MSRNILWKGSFRI